MGCIDTYKYLHNCYIKPWDHYSDGCLNKRKWFCCNHFDDLLRILFSVNDNFQSECKLNASIHLYIETHIDADRHTNTNMYIYIYIYTLSMICRMVKDTF